MTTLDQTDNATVIRCRRPLRLAKTIHADGTIRDYDTVRTIDLCAEPLSGLDDVGKMLERLLRQPDSAVVFGGIIDPARISGVRRLAYPDPETGDKATLRAVPHRWCALDMDDIERPDDVPASDLIACAALAITQLPPAFLGVRCIVQASAGHGIKPGCRLRLWFWLDRPTTGDELGYWLKGRVDLCTFRPAQPIFTAGPVFVGREDHLPYRLADIPGSVAVAVPGPETLKPPPQPSALPHDILPASAGEAHAFIVCALARVRAAQDGQKHAILRNNAVLLGGVQAQAGFTDGEAVQWLLQALPSANDWNAAENTIRWGLDLGRRKPVSIASRRAEAAAAFAAAGPIPAAADLAAPQVTLPNFYTLDSRGLLFRPLQKGTDEPAAPQWLAAPFEVVAETSDAYSGAWGLLLRWQDRNGRPHQWAMPRRLVHADGNAIAAELEESGLSCATGKTAHERIKAFFGNVTAARRVQCVERCGWHQTETGEVFVLPNGETFGAADSNVALQTDKAVVGSSFDAKGTLGEWQREVARYAEGNDRLALFLSAAFAGPLLDVTGEPSGGFHLVGKSQSGKTAMVRAAASVWGEGSARGQVRSWRATANGLEGVAAECSDGLLILDELGQADPREVSEIVYLLANESGKARADRGGAARRRRTWRVMLLSTGELTLAQKMGEAGRHARAGQDVRLADIPADAGVGMGVFQARHDIATAAALADRLRDATRTFFGTAAREYLTALARDRTSGTGQPLRAVLAWRAEFERRHLPQGADGQVRSVAARFGLVAAAGELARSYGVLPWTEGEALRAAGACFGAWLSERGGAGATEDMRAIEQVRAFIAAHGASRFELVAHSETAAFADARIINRAGFKRRFQPESTGEDSVPTGEGSVPTWEYLIMPSVWSAEVCRGLNAKQAADALQAHGLLRGATDRHRAALVNVPGYGKTRVYCISGAILAETEQDAAETQQDAAGTAVA